jgi:hypothetical protein
LPLPHRADANGLSQRCFAYCDLLRVVRPSQSRASRGRGVTRLGPLESLGWKNNGKNMPFVETLSAGKSLLSMRSEVLFESTARSLQVAVISIVATMLGGCGSPNLQIVRVPFISPVVVPGGQASPQPFLMNVGVYNYGSGNSPDAWLKIYTEYFSTPQPPAGQPPCKREDWLHVGILAANQPGWGIADYQIDSGVEGCPCVKDSCAGHVWLDLHQAKFYAPRMPGTIGLHVNWAADGKLSEETVKEF